VAELTIHLLFLPSFHCIVQGEPLRKIADDMAGRIFADTRSLKHPVRQYIQYLAVLWNKSAALTGFKAGSGIRTNFALFLSFLLNEQKPKLWQ
jgi:hypothetical protein